MGQLGFFDLIRRYESLDEIVAIAAMVPFESFRSKLKAIKGELRTSDATRKSLACPALDFCVFVSYDKSMKPKR